MFGAPEQTDFRRTLKREPGEPTEAMLNGIDFEDEVYGVLSGASRQPHAKWEQGIQTVAAILKGAAVQVRAQREINVSGMDFLVYGVLDAIKAGTIYDIKFLNKSFGSAELAGRYLESPQHPAYLYLVPEAARFEYLVSDGSDLYIETYTPAMSRPIHDIIAEFIRSMDEMGLLDEYKQHWLAR
jgi:hypothetical protein